MAKKTGSKILSALGIFLLLIGVAGITSVITKDIITKQMTPEEFEKIETTLTQKFNSGLPGFKIEKKVKDDEDGYSFFQKATRKTESKDIKVTEIIQDVVIDNYYGFRYICSLEVFNFNEIEINYDLSNHKMNSVIEGKAEIVGTNYETEETINLSDVDLTINRNKTLLPVDVIYTSETLSQELDLFSGDAILTGHFPFNFKTIQFPNIGAKLNDNDILYTYKTSGDDVIKFEKERVDSHYTRVIFSYDYSEMITDINNEDYDFDEKDDITFNYSLDGTFKVDSITHTASFTDKITISKK